MFCPKCGIANSNQARFCQNCGFDLKSVIVETPEQPAAQPTSQPAAPPTGQLIEPPVALPVSQSENQPAQPPASQPVAESVSQPAGAQNVPGATPGEVPASPVVPPVVPVMPVQPPAGSVPIQPQYIAVPLNPPYAGFWLRFVAVLIDGLIMSAVFFPVAIIIGIMGGVASVALEGGGQGAGEEIINVFSSFLNLLFIAAEWLYYAFMESSSKQATLGKMVLGLKVTDLNGNRISFARATGRFFGRWLSSLILGIGYLMIAFTEKKQGLHDMVAGTLVVKK